LLVTCQECGAELRLNAKLAGTSVSCPACGTKVAVPREQPAARRKLEIEEKPLPAAPARPPVRRRRLEPLTFYMMASQAVLLALALVAFVAAFRPGSWQPPASTWFGEHPLVLMGLGVVFAFCAFMERYWPRTKALLAVLVVSAGIWAGDQFLHRDVDASRTLALSITLLAVWLSMEHRRFLRR